MFTYGPVRLSLIKHLRRCEKDLKKNKPEVYIYPNNRDLAFLSALETLSLVGLMKSCGYDCDGELYYSVNLEQVNVLLNFLNQQKMS